MSNEGWQQAVNRAPFRRIAPAPPRTVYPAPSCSSLQQANGYPFAFGQPPPVYHSPYDAAPPESPMAIPSNAAPAQRPAPFTGAPTLSSTTPTFSHLPHPTSATQAHPLQTHPLQPWPLQPLPYQLPQPVQQQNRQLFTPEQPFITTNNHINNSNNHLTTPFNHLPAPQHHITSITDTTTTDHPLPPGFQLLVDFNFAFDIPALPLDHPTAQELHSSSSSHHLTAEHELRVLASEGWWEERWNAGAGVGGNGGGEGEGGMGIGGNGDEGGGRELWEVVRDVFGENEFDFL